MSYNASLAPPEIIGPIAEGIRVNFYVTDGLFAGPKIKGKVRPVGGDWLTLRKDGIGILDVRATMETDDGALIYIVYTGTLDLGAEGYKNFAEGKLPEFYPSYGVISDVHREPKVRVGKSFAIRARRRV